ncbi:MAG: MotA/TolQ/ExbB proton channel family protein [Bacillaceae bacterium]|nr:MotA/TolQ/ExbB proton channel family protein [Bacillaceae bacterium]
MTRFNFWSPVGIGIGLIMVALAIVIGGGFSGAKGFISIASFITVFGGLSCALLVHFNPGEFKQSLSLLREIMGTSSSRMGVKELTETFVMLSQKARRDGLLSLEDEADELEETFIKKGILLAVDGVESEMIKEILLAEIYSEEERKRRGLQIFEKAGEWAPAWGMIGTLIGLVLMLQSLNNPATLGPQMAIALITTFYGVVMANLVFHPLAGKISNAIDEEMKRKKIMIEGIVGIQSGQNPMILEEKMSAFLAPEEKVSVPHSRLEEKSFTFEGGRENAL